MKNLIRKNLKHNIIFILSSFSLLFLTASCKEKELSYAYFHELKNAEWKQTDTLFFEIDSTLFSINESYTLSLEVSNSPKYPYRNIWISAQQNFENDSIFSEVEKELELADESGKWNGNGFGILYQSSFIIEENLIFKNKHSYVIKIRHKMEDNPLIGIEKIGVKLSKKNMK